MSEKQIQVYEPSINLPILSDPEEMAELFSENLDGITPEFPRVKFPSGGNLAFEVPGDGEEQEYKKELVGVVVAHQSVNAYWAQKFEGENNPPDCSSMDGKVGFAPEGANVPWAGSNRDCATCPFNQWGSATDQQGNKTNGKACKNMKRIYLMQEGEYLPIMITVPPTSVKQWNTYMVNMVSKGKRFYGVVTKIRLQKAKNSGGIEYSQGVFSRAKDLTKEETLAMKKYADSLKPVIQNVVIDATDYSVEESGGAATVEEDIA